MSVCVSLQIHPNWVTAVTGRQLFAVTR